MAKNMTEKKKNSSRSQMAEVTTRESTQSAKSIKTPAAREERKALPALPVKPEKKAPVRREAKAKSSFLTTMRNNKFGRFIIDAYYELRHKVTWPTFIEARNMTAAVVAISVVIGGILALLDLGLLRLFLLITGGK